MVSSKEADAYEYDINFPSIISLSPNLYVSILDMGCGDGCFTQIIAKRYGKVIGVDGSPRMIQLAKNNLTDLEDKFPTFNTTFDLVIMKLVLMFVENLENVAQEVSKITRTGGCIIISVPHPTYWTAY